MSTEITPTNSITDDAVARAEANLRRVKARAAMEKAKTNPAIADLFAQVDNLKNDVKAAKTKFSGPQSFDSRRKSHELWLDEINSGEEYFRAIVDNGGNQIAHFEQEIEDLVSRMDGMSGEEIQTAIEDINTTAPGGSLDSLRADYEEAQAARKEFSEAKKAGKRKADPIENSAENS